MSLNHPETKPDEEFVGNTHKDQAFVEWLNMFGISSARLGEQAYDINGKELQNEIYRPIFIGKCD